MVNENYTKEAESLVNEMIETLRILPERVKLPVTRQMVTNFVDGYNIDLIAWEAFNEITSTFIEMMENDTESEALICTLDNLAAKTFEFVDMEEVVELF